MKVLIICMTKSTGTRILEVLRCQSIAHKQYLSQVSRRLNTVVQTVEHMHNSVVVSVRPVTKTLLVQVPVVVTSYVLCP